MSLRDGVDRALTILAGAVASGVTTCGAQLYVSLAGDVVANAAFGVSVPGTPMLPDSLLPVHCAVKPVVALTLASLEARGVLRLEQPIGSILPEVKAEQYRRATIAQILNHSAGYPPIQPPVIFVPEEEMLEVALGLPYDRPAGTGSVYSPYLGYLVLGEVVHRVVGDKLSVVAQDLVLEPLGIDGYLSMTRREFDQERDRLGVSFRLSRDGDLSPSMFDLTFASCNYSNPGGVGRFSAKSLGELMQSLMPNSIAVDRGILSADGLDRLLQPRLPAAYDPVMRRTCRYGQGFMVDLAQHDFHGLCSPASFGHSAAEGAVFAMADPARQLVVSVVNTTFGNWQVARSQRHALLNSILGEV